MTRDEFERRARKVHGDAYDYSRVQYVSARQRVVIVCRLCGAEFYPQPMHHLQGRRCPCRHGAPRTAR